MCISLGGSPSPPPLPPLPAPPPRPVSEAVSGARERNRARAALAEGRQSNVLTSGLGLTTPATTVPKTVLGA